MAYLIAIGYIAWHHLYQLDSLTVGDRMQIRNILYKVCTLRRVRIEEEKAMCSLGACCHLPVKYVFIQRLPHDPRSRDINTKNVRY